ncbi:DUF2917 domain-containing protein [Roseateles sp. BYS180W]|uniref:DUF2917 domain-containing protein n=1 Tax=Roseateles rivi TaxID=3299028 RepID=A0ABW7FQQ0_9BURK
MKAHTLSLSTPATRLWWAWLRGPAHPTPSPVLELGPQQPLLRLRLTHPARLRVLQGRLWLTCSGQIEDHWLALDDTLLLPAGADLLLSAEPQALLLLGR